MPRKKKDPAGAVSVIEQGGFQFAVTQGDTIRVPRLQKVEGDELAMDRVLLVQSGDTVKVGCPMVEGAEVRAKVIGHGLDDKVLIVKKRRREDYKRRTGHRQQFTELQITSISA